MHKFSISRNKLLILLILVVTLIIPILISGIYYLNKKNQDMLTNKYGGLSGYVQLQNKIKNLSSDKSITEGILYTRFVKKFNELPSIKEKNKQYEAFLQDVSFLHGLYSYTNNPKLYSIQKDFIEFAKLNFPKYKDNDFSYFCQDSTCAEDPQPKEILTLLTEIEESNILERDKEALIRDITNAGYLSKKNTESKALTYLMIASLIKSSPEASNSAYKNIANKIENYIKTTYPDTVKKIDLDDINYDK